MRNSEQPIAAMSRSHPKKTVSLIELLEFPPDTAKDRTSHLLRQSRLQIIVQYCSINNSLKNLKIRIFLFNFNSQFTSDSGTKSIITPLRCWLKDNNFILISI